MHSQDEVSPVRVGLNPGFRGLSGEHDATDGEGNGEGGQDGEGSGKAGADILVPQSQPLQAQGRPPCTHHSHHVAVPEKKKRTTVRRAIRTCSDYHSATGARNAPVLQTTAECATSGPPFSYRAMDPLSTTPRHLRPEILRVLSLA